MAYDPALGKVVLFGGWNGSSIYGDTWTYLSGAWAPLPEAVHPAARWGASMVWDPTDNELVLFGGGNWTTIFNDTWVFRSGSWVLLHPAMSPPGRQLSGFAWDTSDGYALLFGGIAGGYWNDTWSFVSGNWSRIHPAVSPQARSGPFMAYSPPDGYVQLVSGEGAEYQNNLWTYHAGVWTNRTTSAGGPMALPYNRDGGISEFDPTTNTVIDAMAEHLGVYLNATWSFVGGNFTHLHPSVSPPGIQYSGAAWDSADGYLLVFGGDNRTKVINETWAYSTPLPLLVRETASSAAPFVESSVTFSVKISGGDPPYSIAWQLGNSTTATGGTVSHVYIWPGDYPVNATVTDNESVTNTQTLPITAIWGPQLPIAVATTTPGRTQGFQGLYVPFFGNATQGYPPYRASWEFGDGSAPAAGWNVTHTYENIGTFKANFTVIDRAGRSNTTSIIITVGKVPPVAPPLQLSVVPSARWGNAPLSVQFTVTIHNGSGPYTYEWLFGDGDSSTSGNVTYTYQDAGVWNASLYVVDGAGKSALAYTTIHVNGTTTGPTGPGPGFLGLPGDEGVALVGALVAGIAVVAIALVFLRTRRRSRQKEEEESYEGVPPGEADDPAAPPPPTPTPPPPPPG
jgi:PKD repeat protein